MADSFLGGRTQPARSANGYEPRTGEEGLRAWKLPAITLVMAHLYVACDLGSETGRVLLGQLDQGDLIVSEVRRFKNEPVQEKNSIEWNISDLYNQTLEGLRAIAGYEEPIEGISCTSWAADYLLFDDKGSLMSPAYHRCDDRSEEGMKKVLSKVPLGGVVRRDGSPIVASKHSFPVGDREKPTPGEGAPLDAGG